MNIERVRTLIERAVSEPWPEQLAFIDGRCWNPYYHLFYLIAKELGEGVAVELGVEKGRGVASLAAGSSSLEVVGIDIKHFSALKIVLERFPNIEFIQAPVGPSPRAFSDGIDFLHVDASHGYGPAKNDFGAYRNYLNLGAVICFDDLHAMEDGVLRAFDEFPHPKIQEDRLHPICGYGVMVYD